MTWFVRVGLFVVVENLLWGRPERFGANSCDRLIWTLRVVLKLMSATRPSFPRPPFVFHYFSGGAYREPELGVAQ